jgi:hypothetical protein
VACGITDAKWNEHLAWVKERCRGKRYYLLRERKHTDPVASRAQKATAPRFYQFRMNKAPTGPYLADVRQAADDKCWWCSSSSPGPSQTREHLSKHCRRWKDQQAIMWRAVCKATGGKRTAQNTSMAQLFGDERCTAAILEYLRTTEAGLRGGRRLMGEGDYGEEGTGDDSDEAEVSDEAADDEEAQSEGWESEDEGG